MNHLRFIPKDKDRNLFFATLRKRVDDYFRDSNVSKHSNAQMIIKTIVLMCAYIIPFFCILFIPMPTVLYFVLWTIMGISLAGIGMSIMHDANHGSYSSNKTVNSLVGYSTLNLLGGSVFNWNLQHNILHHTYTNVIHHDDDIADKLVLRLSPHTPVKKFHKYQFLYAFPLYGILTAYWVFLKDFIQFQNYIKLGVNRESKERNRVTLFRIIITKIWYLSVFLIIPLFVLKVPVAMYLCGYFLMHFLAGMILTITFQLAHTVEHTTHPLPDEYDTIENNWAIHQMNTTVNFSRKNKLISWYVGGLNFQIEHHLFPKVCHVHYPQIAPIVKQTAEEFGIPYMENETLLQAVKSHINLLKQFGRPEPTPTPVLS